MRNINPLWISFNEFVIGMYVRGKRIDYFHLSVLKSNAPATMPVQARRLKKLVETVLGWSLETETEFNLDDEVGTATYNWNSYSLKLVFRKL